MYQPTVSTRAECLRTAAECRTYLNDSYSKIDSKVDVLSKKMVDDCQSVLKKEFDSLDKEVASVKERVRLVCHGNGNGNAIYMQ